MKTLKKMCVLFLIIAIFVSPLVAKAADEDKTDIKYALVEAIDEGDITDENLEEAKVFLEKGADINALSKTDGCASLHYSALRGQKKLTEFLLTNGADVNTKDTEGANALRGVAFVGDIEMARLLIKRGINIDNKGGFRNQTALHIAARNGHRNMVKLLITNGANMNAIDENGWTPLRHASRGNHVEVMKTLIADGADINPMNGRDAWSPVSWAAEEGDYDLVKLLIAKGADVNGIGEFGTALNGAARNGHFTIAEFLISKGAKANIKGKFGRMPLHNAAIHDHIDIAKLLMANGANVNAKDDERKTAVDYARKYRHKNMAELLRKYGGERPEEISELLKKNLKDFYLHLIYWDKESEIIYEMLLGVSLKPHVTNSRIAVQIEIKQAKKIIDYLMKEDFFSKAINVAFIDLEIPEGPICTMFVGGSRGTQLYENVGWGPSMLRRLYGLRNILESDARKAMDKFLDRIEGAGEKKDTDKSISEMADSLGIKWGKPFKGLTCRIQLSKQCITTGERLGLTFVFKNHSQNPITLVEQLDGCGALDFDFWVKDKRGISTKLKEPVFYDALFPSEVSVIEPGKIHRRQVLLYEAIEIEVPGRYELSGRFSSEFNKNRQIFYGNYWHGQVSSAPVELVIVPHTSTDHNDLNSNNNKMVTFAKVLK